MKKFGEDPETSTWKDSWETFFNMVISFHDNFQVRKVAILIKPSKQARLDNEKEKEAIRKRIRGRNGRVSR